MVKKNNKNNEEEKQCIYKEYIKYHEQYSKTYGNGRTLVLMQVGSFYEAYATETGGPDLISISKLLGVIRSMKYKDRPISTTNPFIVGFPMVAIIKFLDILIENNYVVVIVDQIQNFDKDKKKGEERKVTNVYSRGTYIENLDKKEGNYITSIYFSIDDQRDSNNTLISVGLSAVDVSLGTVFTHEAYSTKYDECYALDETDRFLNTLNPKEIIVAIQNNSKNKDPKEQKKKKEYIINYLRLNEEICKFHDKIDEKYTKLVFQNEILRQVYPDSKSIISPIEQLDLDKNIFTVVSLAIMFDSIYDKNKNLINNLRKPEHFLNQKHMLLGNNAVRQLDIFENENSAGTGCKYRSLFHIVDKASTSLGSRLIRNRIMSPLINKEEIENSYDTIELFIKNNFYKQVEVYLDNVKDIERLRRKMELNILKPYEMVFLLVSYENIIGVVELLKSKKEFDKINLSKDSFDQIKKMVASINRTFDLDELKKYSNFDIVTTIFNSNIHEELDNSKQNFSDAHGIINDLCDELNNILKGKFEAKKKSKKPVSHLSIKKNNKEGYYFRISNDKALILKAELDKLEHIKVDDKEYKTEIFTFKSLTDCTKIYPAIKTEEQKSVEQCNFELACLNKKYYIQEVMTLFNKFGNVMREVNGFVERIDFMKSAAKVAKLFGYSRPIIEQQKYSFLKAEKMRHPIIERIIDYEYIPHDIELGKEMRGLLLFGLNSSGKSSLMKSLGLNIILAQSGLFVPCQKFTYSPYHNLFTRISSDDNLYRGISSFTRELLDIGAILKRSDNFTIIIGDEVCRTTDINAGISLVASTIIKLDEKKSTFIFATHMHEIMKINKIKDLKHVKPYHIEVKCDEKTNTLVFNRDLKEGSGTDTYGLIVANHILKDKTFIDLAYEIKNEIAGTNESMISGKFSRYNKNVLVNECSLCGYTPKHGEVPLETHHINFQQDCDEDGLVKNKKHIKKNQESNLISLCDKCHSALHNKVFSLDKYEMTSEGKKISMKKE